MRLIMIGAGYADLFARTCFVVMENDVICMGNYYNKIDDLRQSIITIRNGS